MTRNRTKLLHRVALVSGPAVAAALLATLVLAVVFLPLRWVVAVLMSSALGLAMMREPASGLVALALIIPLGRHTPLPISGTNGTDLLVAVILLAWLSRGLACREIRFRAPALAWPLLAMLWMAAASLASAASWREGLPELLKWVEFALVYLVGSQLIEESQSRRQIKSWVIGALLVAGVTQVLIGAYQFVRQVGPESFVLMGRFMRAHGTLQQPNPYAGYLGYLAPVAASLALAFLLRWWRRDERRVPWLGLLLGGVTTALAGGILMSWSRGAWLGLTAALATVLAATSRRAAWFAAVVVLAFALAVTVAGTEWIPGTLAGRLSDLSGYIAGPDPARTEVTDANFSVLERLAHWQAGWRMFEAHPWLGVGIGNYGVAYAAYALPRWYDPLGHAHNVFINFLAETGIMGGLGFLVFWLGIAWMGMQLVRRQNDRSAALAVGLLGTWVYLSVHSLFDNLFVQHLQLQLALLLSLLPDTEPLVGDCVSRGSFGNKRIRVSAARLCGLAYAPPDC